MPVALTESERREMMAGGPINNLFPGYYTAVIVPGGGQSSSTASNDVTRQECGDITFLQGDGSRAASISFGLDGFTHGAIMIIADAIAGNEEVVGIAARRWESEYTTSLSFETLPRSPLRAVGWIAVYGHIQIVNQQLLDNGNVVLFDRNGARPVIIDCA
ncbi:MAG: hypothetical protein ABL886_02055, partial [Rhodoglobus sp.]